MATPATSAPTTNPIRFCCNPSESDSAYDRPLRTRLADLGYEGEAEAFTIPIKKPKGKELTVDEQAFNAVHGALRCRGERANSLLKTTFKALRHYRSCC